MPTAHMMDLEKNANAPYGNPPKNPSDINRIVRVVLDAEAAAIEVYQKIAKKTKDKAPVIHQLVMHILAEEGDHEEMFESLQERR